MIIHPIRNHRQLHILAHFIKEGIALAAIYATWTSDSRSVYSPRNTRNRQYCIHDPSKTFSCNETSSDSEAVHLVVVEEPAKHKKLSRGMWGPHLLSTPEESERGTEEHGQRISAYIFEVDDIRDIQ